MKTNARTLARTLPFAVLTASALTTTALAQPAFHLIGNPPGLVSEVFGLSRDGTVACGTNETLTGSLTSSFSWTMPDGRQDFLSSGSRGYGISADGTTIVGGFGQPYRRLADGTIQSLGTLPGFTFGDGVAVSADGSVVTGTFTRSSSGVSYASPFRWTPSGGMQPLPGLGGNYTQAHDMSDDGKTIVGTYAPSSLGGPTKAFVWREGAGATFLTGPTGADWCEAHAVNIDGSIVAGDANGLGGCRWVNGVAQGLGTIGDWRGAEPQGMSDDGSVIIGQLFDSPTHVSFSTFVWTESTGMMESVDYFKMMGVPLPMDGEYSFRVFSVSGDGLSFGGPMGRFGTMGLPAQGFVASIPVPGSGFVLPVLALYATRRRREINSLTRSIL